MEVGSITMSGGSAEQEPGYGTPGKPERRSKPRPVSSGLGDMLVEEGLITSEQLGEALQEAESRGKFFGQVLDELGHFSDSQLTSFLVRRCKIPHLNLLEYNIEGDVLELLPKSICRQFLLVPIDLMGSNITLAMVNPLDVQALAQVSAAMAKFKIKRILCSYSDFEVVSAKFLKEAEEEENMSMENTFGLGPAPVAAKKEELPAVPVEVTGKALSDSGLATMKVEPSTFDADGPRKPKHVSLVCLAGWEIGKEVALSGIEGEHILGRSRGANTCLDSQLVSREHAKVVCNGEYGDEHYVLTDMGSSNGT